MPLPRGAARGLTSLAALHELAAFEFKPRVFSGSAPAAGAEFSITVPGGEVWFLINTRATLTTSVAVANRGPSLIVDDGTTQLLRVRDVTNITASQAIDINWIGGLGAPIATGTASHAVVFPMGLVLPSGYRLRSLTEAIDAGDQWNAPVVWSWNVGDEALSTRLTAQLAALADVTRNVTLIPAGSA